MKSSPDTQLRQRYVDTASLVVVKIGSATVTQHGRLNRRTISRIASDLAWLKRTGRDVIVVSSGAIASGLAAMGLTQMPRAIVDKQAAAAIGQPTLLNAWADALRKARLSVAQVLLTSDDLDNRRRYINARHTLSSLVKHGVIPIVNENDSVSFEEIKMGDNDHLSALVTTLTAASMLLLLTDVDGLRHGGPYGELISTVHAGEDVTSHVAKTKSSTGVGGMQTKIDAATLVGSAGIPAIIASGKTPGTIREVMTGKTVGTFFEPSQSSLDPRRRWIATATRVRGAIIVDQGAKAAIIERKASLLPPGIVKVDGRFDAGTVVRICDRKGNEFARGLASYASDEIEKVRGKASKELPTILGYQYQSEIVHRDDLVVL